MKRLIISLLLFALSIQTAYAIDTVSELGEALELNRSKINITTRDQWGADESKRFYNGIVENPQIIEISEKNRIKYADELKLRKTIVKQEGKTLIWPLQYAEKVTKFILHHTATDIVNEEAVKSIKDIYHYHAVKRGWGDIGYNYIIDREGSIYEGRYGGEGVVGGHAGIGNIGSIGIAVLGTYSEEKVPQKVVNALIKLIAEKAKIHNIDPDGYSSFRGEHSLNVIGHRDVMATDCPGDKLEALIPAIAKLAARLTETTTISNLDRLRMNDGYNFEDKSSLLYLDMNPGEQEEIIIRFENTGEKTWNKDTFIVVNSDPAFANVVSFPDKQGVVLAKMNESSVAPGQTATFNVKVKTELKSDLIYLNIAPVVNGQTKLGKYLVLPLLVTNADYSYEIVEKRVPPAFIEAGKEFNGYVDIKNTGNVTWAGQGEHRVTLGADHERDRISEFASPVGTRLGYLLQQEVKPGETGRFIMKLKAPEDKGYYTEYFTPVMEGIAWFDDYNNSFKTYVYEHKYDAAISDSIPNKQIALFETRTMWVKLRNTGGTIWKKKDFSAIYKSSEEIEVTNISLAEDSVTPGQMGTIVFTVKAPAETGKIYVYLRPRINNANIGRLVKFPITVVPQITKSNLKGDNIRVKLSFDGLPEITSDNSFKVYKNSVEISEIQAGETYKVPNKNDIYRLAPEGNGIMKIANYENRPAWNTSLNDNEFRGIIEVREEGVINELPMEDYLKGLAENQESEPIEKMKALIILARSYALHYVRDDAKFPGKPYHLTDDPETSQKYLGYGYEKRAPQNAKAVLATRGKVVKYDGKIAKTPYFSQSDGRTKSAEEVWGWTHTPYLQSVDDSYCEGFDPLGHGVGMSGCGSRGMANAGKTYNEIIKYFFQNVIISKIY
ncbi:MAG: SpoIID/LytB domain-containing protein [Patescibacteria group bacterium]|nr:SpoIID/LytB domain-containing protein [Patescibacteria group bacterium]